MLGLIITTSASNVSHKKSKIKAGKIRRKISRWADVNKTPKTKRRKEEWRKPSSFLL